MSYRLAALCLCALLAACAGSLQPTAAGPELEMRLETPEGKSVSLEEVERGQPLLVFLFATYDEASQFALVPLQQFAAHEPRLRVIGVALQPDAKQFLNLFRSSLDVELPLYFDPDNQILRGGTALGKIRGVPAYVALDAQGRIRKRKYGPATSAELRALADAALQP